VWLAHLLRIPDVARSNVGPVPAVLILFSMFSLVLPSKCRDSSRPALHQATTASFHILTTGLHKSLITLLPTLYSLSYWLRRWVNHKNKWSIHDYGQWYMRKWKEHIWNIRVLQQYTRNHWNSQVFTDLKMWIVVMKPWSCIGCYQRFWGTSRPPSGKASNLKSEAIDSSETLVTAYKTKLAVFWDVAPCGVV
jgi:hypothetical protein